MRLGELSLRSRSLHVAAAAPRERELTFQELIDATPFMSLYSGPEIPLLHSHRRLEVESLVWVTQK